MAVRKAYRRQALLTHPDRNPSTSSKADSGERFRQVNEAYQVLIDESKRREYDRHGMWPPPDPYTAPSRPSTSAREEAWDRDRARDSRRGTDKPRRGFRTTTGNRFDPNGTPHPDPPSFEPHFFPSTSPDFGPNDSYGPYPASYVPPHWDRPPAGPTQLYPQPIPVNTYDVFNSMFADLDRNLHREFPYAGTSQPSRPPSRQQRRGRAGPVPDVHVFPPQDSLLFAVPPPPPPPPPPMHSSRPRSRSRGHPPYGEDGWVRTSKVTQIVNGVKFKMWSGTDHEGNEYITYRYSNGQERYFLNSVEQPNDPTDGGMPPSHGRDRAPFKIPEPIPPLPVPPVVLPPDQREHRHRSRSHGPPPPPYFSNDHPSPVTPIPPSTMGPPPVFPSFYEDVQEEPVYIRNGKPVRKHAGQWIPLSGTMARPNAPS